jgi:hypothetical protein
MSAAAAAATLQAVRAAELATAQRADVANTLENFIGALLVMAMPHPTAADGSRPILGQLPTHRKYVETEGPEIVGGS